MKSNFKNNIELLFENKKKPSLKILLEEDEDKKSDKEEKEEKEESKSDDPFDFAQEEKTDEETPEEIPSEENIESIDDKQMSDKEQEDLKTSMFVQSLNTELETAEKGKDLRYSKLNSIEKNNPISAITDSKEYKLKNLLFEKSNDGKNIAKKINSFLDDHQDKISNLKKANKQEIEGYGIEINDLLNKSVKAVNEFEKKIHPADVILNFYEKKIVELAPLEEIDDMLDEFRKEFCKRVKKETQYTDYERPEFYAGSNSNYNSGVVGQKSG
jgi:hypothetical protein